MHEADEFSGAVTPAQEEQPTTQPAPEEAPKECAAEAPAPKKKKAAKPAEPSTDADFDARYHAAKEKDIAKLAKEIEEKNSRDTTKKKRNWWIKTILMLVLIGGSIALMFTINGYLSEEGTKRFSEMIAGASLPFFFVFLGVILLDMILESAKYAYLLKISTGKFRFKNSIKTMFLGRYYDGITPLGTGGQPFQIYYLHKKDIPAGVATAVPLVRFIISTFVFCLIAVVLFIFTSHMGLLSGWDGTTILIVSWVFMALNFLVPVLIIVFSLFPRAGKKLVVRLVAFLSKIRIVKHKYPTMKKYVYEIDEYRHSLKALIKSWKSLIPLVLICILETAVYTSLPFFAMLAIAGPNVTDNHLLLLFQMCCLMVVSFYSSSFVPTPGNSGASEAMTMIVFLTVSGINSVLGWIVLLWRFATFYLYIVSGIGINIFEIIRSAVRPRRANKSQK